MTNPPDTRELLDQIRQGSQPAIERLMARHRELLRQYIELRLDPALRQRVDASDVVQETQLEMLRRLDDYLQREPMPFAVWIRKTAYQNLLRLRRQHLRAELRSRWREIPLSESVSVLLVGKLVAGGRQVLDELVRNELALRVQETVSGLAEMDREILLLRAYEGMDNQSVSLLLDLDTGTSSKRYARALLKLRRALIDNGAVDP